MTDLAKMLQQVQQLDRDWIKHEAGHDNQQSLPWMPFPVYDFIALMAEALPAAPGDRFLEIGCGPGTRMLIAQRFFGLDAHGFDRVPEYVEQARELELAAGIADALTFEDYGEYDLIFFNRPFRDQELQAKLEAKVWADMKPDAVVICANLRDKPPSNWWIVLDDWELRRGTYQKP